MKNVAGSSGKWLDVGAERFPGWIAAFGVRHGGGDAGAAALTVRLVTGPLVTGPLVTGPPVTGPPVTGPPVPGRLVPGRLEVDHAAFTAPDGSVAKCYPPFPPAAFDVPAHGTEGGTADGPPAGPLVTDPPAVAEAFTAHARTPRTVGVLLVRLGGYAVGVFSGYPPVLADGKTGSRLVHGRSAAGGWSQHRFARRREKQANEALAAAADAAVTLLGRHGGAAALDAVVLGGDKRAVAELRDDPRLAPYLARATDRFLTVPDPKRAVLESAPKLFTAVRIWLTEAP